MPSLYPSVCNSEKPLGVEGSQLLSWTPSRTILVSACYPNNKRAPCIQVRDRVLLRLDPSSASHFCEGPQGLRVTSQETLPATS